jgi:RNA polymerase sigma-70 factor, ECF subfamily
MPPNDSNSTRLSLLLRIRDLSDAEAWSHFVDQYGPYVARCCQAMGLQEADAADTTQAVLVKLMSVMQSWEKDGNKGSFRGWLKRVTQNVAIDLRRSWKERAAGDSSVMRDLSQLADNSFEESLWKSVETAYQQELLVAASHNVQLRVQPKTWMAYQMSCVDNRTASDVAQQLQIAIGEVYVARSRVLKMLRTEIERLEEQDSLGPPG